MRLGTPSPLLGYFAGKMLVFNGLQRGCAGKILMAKGLLLKYSLSMR